MAVNNVAEETFEVLRRFGVDRVFGNPGSTEMHMFMYWPDDLDYVPALQEASVVAMADGYAQRSGKPGFVNVHTAAGLGNAMGAVVSASRNNTPLVITAGQQTRAMLPTNPYLSSPRSTLLPVPYVKWADEPAGAADVPAAIARALLTALTPGAQVFTYHVHTDGPFLPPGAQVLHMTDDPGAAFSAPVGESVICSLDQGVCALNVLISPTNSTPPGPWARPEPGPLQVPLQGDAVTHLLAELLPEDAVVYEEAPSYREIIRTQLNMKSAGKYHNSFSGRLGWALPAAVGGGLADPGGRAVCLMGDGSMMYSIQALWTAARRQLPLTVVVFDNGEYGAMKEFKTLFGIDGFAATIETALNLPGIDLVAIARGLGVAAERADDPATLPDVLHAAFRSGGPNLLDVPVAPLRGVGPV